MGTSYDAIVIGTGQAGPALAGRLTSEGMKTAIIERKRFGGTCVNYGCIPTKTLIASARAAHVARRAGDFGVTVGGAVGVDMKRVKARKDEIVNRSSGGLEKSLRGMENLTVYDGHARFVGPHAVQVDGERLEAERIFIDTGARAAVPPIPGLDRVDYLTNSTILGLDFLPEHLIVVGGSYVGMEFAQMYRRFGSRVTVLEKSERVVTSEDEDVSAAVREILEGEGVEFRCEAECIEVEAHDSGVLARLACKAGEPEIVGSHLLIAAGRQPNTDDLGLDKAGIRTLDSGHIEVDDELHTSVDGVWALGEVNGRGAFTHTSYNDYQIVAANLFDGARRRVTERYFCSAMYIDPPLGRVGMTEREARESGREMLMGTMPMSKVQRANERSETQGFMKVLVDAGSERVVGAAILGIRGDEVVHSFIQHMYADVPYTVMEQRAVAIHPTVSELLASLLADLKPLS